MLTEPELVAGLQEILGGEAVLHGPAIRRAYDCDAYTVDKSAPAVVALPTSTDEVAQIVRWCNRFEVAFTARGAGTGLSGGALAATGGIIISMKKMTAILNIDPANRCLLAQAGAVNRKISEAVAHLGLHFAPDPSSQYVSTLGGNISENSGGPHTLKYGVTAPHILGLTMVSPEGEILTFGGKLGQPAGFDFLGILVGAEGTMGIVTEAWVKLTPIPTGVATGLATFDNIRGATEAVSAIIASGLTPSALEMMDHGILGALKAAFGFESEPGAAALLLIECDSDVPENGPAIANAELDAVQRICQAQGAIAFRIAQTETERQELWTARKKGIGAMGRLAPTIVTHDGVIPRSKLPEMLDFVYETAAQAGIGVANLFHAGDGNLHPCFYFDDRDQSQVDRAIHAGEEIMRKCIELGGSVTGEHGIGVEKQDLMSEMFTAEDLALQAKIKEIFNPGTLCNPCKVLPNQKGCVEHKKRWRGAAW